MTMKLAAGDIELKSRNIQIINSIEAKFGSLEGFAAFIGMSSREVRQQLKQRYGLPERFGEILRVHMGDYHTLWRTEEQQIEDYVNIVSRDIYQYGEAGDIEVLEKVLKLSEGYFLAECTARSYVNMSIYHSRRNDHDRALKYLELAMDVRYLDVDMDIFRVIFNERMTVCNCMKDYDRAYSSGIVNQYEYDMKEADLDTQFWFYYNFSVCYINRRKYTEARETAKKSLECAQSDYQRLKAYSHLGICHKKLHRYKRALENYAKALEFAVSPRDLAICHNNMASLYQERKQRRLAKESINTALKYADPGEPSIYVAVYSTYAEIYGTQESSNTLLEIVEKNHRDIYLSYMIAALDVVLVKIEDDDRFRGAVLNLIEIYEGNNKVVSELLRVLGEWAYRMLKKKKEEEDRL